MPGDPGASHADAWHALADYLAQAGPPVLFGLPGDDLAALAAVDSRGLRLVLCRDQRNAVFMATGYALGSGGPGVCVIGKGPAVANAVTGLVEARASGAPVVLVAGGTAVDRRGSGAFQELDQLALVSPAVKWAHRVDHPDRVAPALERAFLVAASDPRGPVYLELPDHLIGAPVPRARPWLPATAVARARATSPVRGAALTALRSSRRPVVLVGGGMRHRNPDGVVERFAERIGAAVFTTASGRGAVAEDHPLFCGLSGLYTPPGTEELWREADLVVAVGSRLEETATTGWDRPDRPVLQVDVDPASLSTDHPGPRVVGDGADVLAAWVAEVDRPPDRSWRTAVERCRAAARGHAEQVRGAPPEGDRPRVVDVLAAIDEVLPPDRVLVQENGLQDMWSYFYPHYTCRSAGGCIAPSEQTTLGFGAAAAAGARLAAPDRPVVAFVGDGAFNLFRSDLATLDREGIGVLYVVLRNGGYGWLHAQLDRHRLDPARHGFASDAPDAGGAGSHFPVTDRTGLVDAVRRGYRVTARGGVAVVHVDVRLADRHPALDNLIGDFPAHVAQC
ncbi:thiamine pyrophosphate-binding protein [Saccharothrix xinjiangensis]|uniref:Thiamine pyrophosphate-binding protein n=1 Tax=Saccharothrix xinjiangensis TaxID=204798 RepID=A0ABV9Y688_9PSEU